eukprot:c43097_g1_i1 orf=27-176(-)
MFAFKENRVAMYIVNNICLMILSGLIQQISSFQSSLLPVTHENLYTCHK